MKSKRKRKEAERSGLDRDKTAFCMKLPRIQKAAGTLNPLCIAPVKTKMVWKACIADRVICVQNDAAVRIFNVGIAVKWQISQPVVD